jgi:hypothetical protein
VRRGLARSLILTWIDEVDGKVKSLPQVPGYVPCPNSAHDWLIPSHLSLPLAAAEVVVAGAVEVDVGFVEVVDVFRVVESAPGRHWLYQSFW